MSTTTATQETSAASTAASTAAAASSTTLATSTRTSSADSSSSSFSSPSATTVALTTTFTPPASCTQHNLSLLSSPWYNLWLNEPSPVPGSLVTDCYPTQFIDGYTSLFNQTSSIAPVFSPLVCPQAWTAVNTFSSNYIACCPSGFLLHPPSTIVDSNRPAYGGTCYTTFTIGQSMNVLAYNSTTLTATQPWVASSSADQAYAHVIDGFAMAEVSVSTTASASAATSSSSSSSSNSLSGGAIAGIVIGIVAFLGILVGFALWFFRRRRQQRVAAAGPSHEVGGDDAYHEKAGDQDFRKELSGAPAGPKAAELESPGPIHELDSTTPAELDGGWKGAEVHTPGTEKEIDRRREMFNMEDSEARRLDSEGTVKVTSEEPRTPPPRY
ncbi:hypothetical protein GTA08_BOTSDO09120 [Botryosphaeria dothidea]|uniref:Cfem domain protein n=1 Tax=Botryosphaeria dothidea TaxID=55169 RepID=A0A8H4MZC1_9PEZI|nr:hypothetical protein GTA08_BOTSDO09120 [Botryosphaeria dothidea]